MTPKEQDNELREKLIELDGELWDYQLDKLVQLITADRKRVALEARIHEIGLMQHQARVNLKTSNAVAEWGDIRITELKRELDK